jgi:hypothetical protein
MSKWPPPEVRKWLEANLRHVEFRPKPPDPIPGFVTFEGVYTNVEQQRFILTLVGREDDGALERYGSELLVAFLARPEDPSPTRKEAGESKPLTALIEEGKDDDSVLALDVRCDSLPEDPGPKKRGQTVTVFGRIDPVIAKNHRHCYRGPERVVAAAAKGRVMLGGLTGAPNEVPVPPARDRDANRACWVKGEAPAPSTYALNAAWYRVLC